jgi:hypothetical protein
MAQKRADYFAAGTQAVWDVDLLGDEVIQCYSFDKPLTSRVFRRGDVATAEPALTGWRFIVSQLFSGDL